MVFVEEILLKDEDLELLLGSEQECEELLSKMFRRNKENGIL